MSDERDRVLIGRIGDRVFIEHTASGTRIEVSARVARAVRDALEHFTAIDDEGD